MSEAQEEPPFQWTLGQIRKMNLELEAACRTPDCGWFSSFNVDQLIEQVGPDYWLPDPASPAANAAAFQFHGVSACASDSGGRGLTSTVSLR